MTPDVEQALQSGKFSTCPCCEQTVKLHRRRIAKHTWRALRALAIKGTMTSKEAYTSYYAPDIAHMAYWGLVENEKPGLWKITDKGLSFVFGTLEIPKYAFIYNKKVYRYSDEMITSKTCREAFDLDEVLNFAA